MVGGYAYTLFTHYDYKGGNKMAQVDINKLKGNNAELAKSNELNGTEQTERLSIHQTLSIHSFANFLIPLWLQELEISRYS